jgi:diguanylate cyclase (GGDEF)-like protein/PAS domain S-box-containing protein
VKVVIFAPNTRAERRLRARFEAWGLEPVSPNAAGDPPDVVVVCGPDIGPLLDQVERWLPKFRTRPPVVAVNVDRSTVTPAEMARCDAVVLGRLRRDEFAARLQAATRRRIFQGAGRPFRALVEALPLGVFATNPQGACEFTNPAYRRITGLSAEEAEGTGWAKAFHPEDRDALFDAWTAATLEGKPYHGVVRMTRPDGTTAWVRITTGLVRDGGRTLGHVGVLEDITQQREAEQRLREAHTLLDVIQRASLDAIFVVGKKREVLYFNERVIELWQLGGTRNLARYEDRMALLESQMREPHRFRRFVEAAYADPNLTGRMDIVLNDGRVFELYTAPAITPDGEWIGRVWYYRDITDRRRAEEERDRYFRYSIDLLAILDVDAQFVRVNPAWTRVLGWTEEELLGRSIFDFVHPEDARGSADAVVRVRNGEELRDVRARYRTKDGGYRWLSWNVAPTRGYAYAVVRDVTELVEAQERQEELLAALEARMRDLEEQARALDELRAQAEYAATHDALTGVWSRRAWFDAAAEIRPKALALFDIDHFKRINDTYGHPAGDAVIVEVCRRLEQALGSDTVLGRLGGEEFGALFQCDPAEAERRAEAAVAHVAAEPVRVDRRTAIPVSVSAGLSAWRAAAGSREASLARTYEAADKALYRAKRAGRNRLVVAQGRAAAA